MKKEIAVAGVSVSAVVGLVLTGVQWVSGELKEKASGEEVHQINHDINRLDEKIDKVLFYMADMQKTLNRAHGGRANGHSREGFAHIGSDSNGAVVPSH